MKGLAAAFVAVLLLLAAAGPASGQSGPGPFAVSKQQSGKGQTIYRPSALGTLGYTTHPVVLWGNGTATLPAYYEGLLRHWASHGFIVAAANTPMAFSGKEMLAGLDYLSAQNRTPGSPFAGRVDTSHVAASGHSQGGGGAIAAGTDPRVGVTLPLQPGPPPSGAMQRLHGPMFILAGEDDFVVPAKNVKSLYGQAGHIVAIYGNLAGANHGTPMGDGGGYRGPATAWLRAQLMGDEEARELFFGPCGYCASGAWTEFLRNARAQAVAG